MLSQIERGDANPTFATLWNVIQALGVELHELTTPEQEPPAEVEVIQSTMMPTMTTEDQRVTLRALSPVDTADTIEWYELEIAPNGVLQSSPHGQGTVEHLSVLTGELAVTSGHVVEKVVADSTARYRGDLAHEIANSSPTEPARALLVVLAGSR